MEFKACYTSFETYFSLSLDSRIAELRSAWIGKSDRILQEARKDVPYAHKSVAPTGNDVILVRINNQNVLLVSNSTLSADNIVIVVARLGPEHDFTVPAGAQKPELPLTLDKSKHRHFTVRMRQGIKRVT